MSEATGAIPRSVGGSFRDPNGRVYRLGQRVLRGLSDQARDNFRSLVKTQFFRTFTDAGELTPSEEISRPAGLAADESWSGWLEHQAVPVISYPYEWTFSMLRDAADLQLRLLEAALQEGWSMKDATPYNVQFVAGKPQFIDLPSFEPLQPGATWDGYRQFCQMNLFPLMLQAYKRQHFQPYLRGRISGIDVQSMAGLFSLRDRLRKGVFSHVWLQSLLDRKYGDSHRDIGSELKSAGMNRELLLANVRKLRKLLGHLEWTDAHSEWANYTQFHNYSDADHQAKSEFVERAAAETRASVAWDLGSNTGQFSRIAAQHSRHVLAMDADHLAVEQLYLSQRAQDRSNILPLVQNVADPSPDWGWNLAERQSLPRRAAPDLVLALALIHHLVISANIPIPDLIGWLADLGSQLVIEFVSREDEKVRQLLKNRSEKFSDYNRSAFEHALQQRFEVIRQANLRDGLRTLYYCQPR